MYIYICIIEPRLRRHFLIQTASLEMVASGTLGKSHRSGTPCKAQGNHAGWQDPSHDFLGVVIVYKPTLGQAWPQENPWPQCAFKMSMFKAVCSSH